MKKILLTLVGIICSLGTWADISYKSVDGTTVFSTTDVNVNAWISAGWVTSSQVNGGNKNVTVDPSTDKTIESTSYSGVNVKSGNRTTTFYLTNISELKIYSVNSSSSDARAIKCTITPEGGTSTVQYADAAALATAVIDLTDLETTKNYAVKVEGFGSDHSSAADFYIYALKAYGVSSGNVYPTITTNPVSASYMQNVEAEPLTVVATPATEGASLTYQWYCNSTSSATGGTMIGGATDDSYTPSTSVIGTTYYYCVIEESDGTQSATTVPASITVEGVVAENATIKFTSTGAADTEGVYIGTMVSASDALSSETIVDDIIFTESDYRLKFGGKYTSSNSGRFVKINVTGPCQINVYGSSNSGSEVRHISIGTELGANGIKICNSDVHSISAGTYEYAGDDAGSVYVYPDNSDFYIYAVKVAYGNTRSFTSSISGERIGTFSAPYNTSIPEGVTAYTAEFNEDNTSLILTEIADVIPANTGVFVMGEKGSYKFEETTASASASSCLTATAGNSVIATAGNMVLSTYNDGEETNAAMLPAATGLVINSYKAYLASSSAAKSVAISFADATAISSVKNEAIASVKKLLENGKIVIVTPAGKFNAVGSQIK